jgi:hypothetical protein
MLVSTLSINGFIRAGKTYGLDLAIITSMWLVYILVFILDKTTVNKVY